MPPFMDVAGERFGRLVVIERVPFAKGNARWKCRCDCGNTTEVSSNHLLTGHTKSCGCIRTEATISQNIKRTSHGSTRTPEYHAWIAAKSRCYNQRNASYLRYGGAGIKMCDEWKEDFSAFLSSVGNRPSPLHSLDRFPNNRGNYEPGNVRWATKSEQTLNRDVTIKVRFRGRMRNLRELTKEMGVSHFMVRDRLYKGWKIEDALTVPTGTDRLKVINEELVSALKALLPKHWRRDSFESMPVLKAARRAVFRAEALDCE